MEDRQQQVLKVLITRDHVRQILEVGRKLFEFDHVVWLDVVPTPDKLGKSLLLRLLTSHDLRMFPRIEYLAQLLKNHSSPDELPHPLICLDD